MVYIITDSEKPSDVMLVKAASWEELEHRVVLKRTQTKAGALTTSEVQALNSASFIAIVA